MPILTLLRYLTHQLLLQGSELVDEGTNYGNLTKAVFAAVLFGSQFRSEGALCGNTATDSVRKGFDVLFTTDTSTSFAKVSKSTLPVSHSS